jgi:hypothetical protein
MRRWYLGLALLPLLTLPLWPRPAPVRPTYGVGHLVALLATHPALVTGRPVRVAGFYHHGCPFCTWDAPPSLTPDASWGGPSLLVALPEAEEPAWVRWWRALPLVGALAPTPPSGLPEGPETFSGIIVACPGANCGGPPYLLQVRSVHG